MIVSKYDFIDIGWGNNNSEPGILAPNDPEQSSVTLKPWNHKSYLIKPLAKYKVNARVLLKSNYWFSAGAEIVPMDLTLGWGPMSNQAIIDQLSIVSGYRNYYWSAKTPPISPDEINRHAANTHIVPKDDQILKKLKKISVGDIVTLSGYLIQISRADGWHWNTSLTREDSGGGACELMWVESVIIER